MRSRCYLFVVLLGLVALSGCGNAGMAPVKGRVTCNGQPVPYAAIIFSPMPKNEGDIEGGKASAAETDADGRFTLSTSREGDGGLIGKHRVAITLDERAKIGCKSKVMIVEVKPGQNEVEIDLAK